MDPEKARIQARLEEVLASIYCPAVGCWPVHGCHYEYYHDGASDRHVLEVWPVGIDEPDAPEKNGRWRKEHGIHYELAEFDFAVLMKGVRLDRFHFSQFHSLFQIGWQEMGYNLELRVHIEPLARGRDEFLEG
jgi:hypothetical protein